MKQLLIWVCLLFAFGIANAQEVTITAIEYFFDEDPGFGQGTAIPVSEGTEVDLTETLSTSTLSKGFHNLYFRAKESNGFWGPYEGILLYINTNEVISDIVQIESLEYFFDEDPGAGNGTPISVSESENIALSNNLNTSGLAVGFHTLYLRGKLMNGAWGPYESKLVYVNTSEVINGVVEIESLEYFFDEDPGAGSGFPLTVSQASESSLVSSLNTSGLTKGFHNLFVRGKRSNGVWGPYESKVVHVNEGTGEVIEIDKVEYFVDNDPGVGLGQTVDFESAEELYESIEILSAAYSLGEHKFYVRAKASGGAWGQYEIADFTVVESILTEDFETGLPGTNGSGDYTLSSGIWTSENVSAETVNTNGGATAARMLLQNASIASPIFYGVSDVSFYYSLPAAGSQTFTVLLSVDGSEYTAIDTVVATLGTYELYESVINEYGTSVSIKIQTDPTTGSTQDLVIDDFYASSRTPLKIDAYYPKRKATDIAVDSAVAFTFSQDVLKGAGSVFLVDLFTGLPADTVDISEVSLLGDSVFFDHNQLDYETEYAVLIGEGTFTTSAADMAFGGILDSTLWTFTTEPDPNQPTLSADVSEVILADVDAATEGNVGSYTLTSQYLKGDVSISLNLDETINGSYPSIELSLDQITWGTNLTILEENANGNLIYVRAVAPANNGRSVAGTIVHYTLDGNVIDLPVSATELSEASSVSFTSPLDNETITSGSSVGLEWSVTNMFEEPLELYYAYNGGSYHQITTTTSSATSFQFSTTSLAAGDYDIVIDAPYLSDQVSDTINISLVNPSITVLTPNGGESLTVGQPYEITWTTENVSSSDLIEIRYTTGGGANSYIIADGTFSMFAENSFTWTVPFDYANDARIMVRNTSIGIFDESDEVFGMVPATSLTLLTPNGGNQLNPGETFEIIWSGTSLSEEDQFEISYSTDGGETYQSIISGVLSEYPEYTYSWVVPEVRSNTVKVKVSDLTAGLSDESDVNLTIGDYTAPAFNGAPQVAIIGGKHSITVNLNEAATVYYMIQYDGYSYPNATQVKNAAEGGNPFTGQYLVGSYELQSINTPVTIQGSAAYTPDARFDIFVTAEDADGNLNAGYGIPNVVAQYTPLQRDSLALIAIYNQMEGSGWSLESDWANSPLVNWSEITIDAEQQRITEINLGNKGLSGALPSDITQLTALTNLDLSDNDLNYIPSLISLETLESVRVVNNHLTFASIVPNLQVSGFDFRPQQKIGEETYHTLDAGSNYTFSIPFMGSGAQYQWFYGPLIPGKRFNNNVDSITVGGNVQNYVINNINIENQGTYRLKVTHPSVEDFVIEGYNQNIFGKTDISGTIKLGESVLSGGDVFVYRQTPEGPFVREDSTGVSATGFYEIKDVVLGNFIVQVKPDRTNNPTAIQTYYISSERYNQADTLVLDSKKEAIDIDLLFYDPSPFDPAGAKIGGYIESEFAEDTEVTNGRTVARRKVRKAACSMRRFKSQGRPTQDEETEIAYYIESDDEGYFSFEGVEPNTYLINIEFPGVPMDTTSEVIFEISEEKENQVFEVTALITELGIQIEQTEVLFNWKPYLKDLVVYPNPTEGFLAVDYLVYRNIQDLKVVIYDNQGRMVLMKPIPHDQGLQHFQLDLTRESVGIYHMVLSSSTGSFSKQIKISKQ